MTGRRLCQVSGFEEVANDLLDVFFGLQNAHCEIVRREAKKLTPGISRSSQEGKIGKGKTISNAQIAPHLGLSRKELPVLDNLRGPPPTPPLD